MAFLFAICIIFLLLLFIFPVLGITILRGILRRIFGFGPSRNNGPQHGPTYDSTTQTSGKKKKIIDPTEGEYVDFEEVKDDEE